MKPNIILCLALVAFNLSLQARGVRLWSGAELMEASDLVVVGRPIKVKDLDESNSLGWDKSIGWSQLTFRGVETTFKISEILKGTPASDQVVLHHYRFDKVNPPNGPTFVEFTPGDTNEYLLYLINDGTNRYAPTSGQIDPQFPIKPSANFIGVAPQPATNKDLTKQIAEILTECQKIKPGMSRAELLKVFGTEGGLSTAARRIFVYRDCPYIKVDIDFTLQNSNQKTVEERPTDTIIKISKPYLDWSIGD
ncbi:MAG TPA: hypothetical protein VGO67_26060 [Verrucomicrobiae bacterium]|jgi:hypothetical protein